MNKFKLFAQEQEIDFAKTGSKLTRFTVEYEGDVEYGCSGGYIIIDHGVSGDEWIEYSGPMTWENAVARVEMLNRLYV